MWPMNGFFGRNGIIHFVTVKRHTRFKSQCVARAQSARDKTVIPTGLIKRVPDCRSRIPRGIYLHSVFSGVSCCGNQSIIAAYIYVLLECVVFIGNHGIIHKPLQDWNCPRPLKRDLTHGIRNVDKLHIAEAVGVHPFEIFIFVGRIHNHHVLVFILLVENEIGPHLFWGAG